MPNQSSTPQEDLPKPASSTRKTFFDFFGLPPELRDRIYDFSIQDIIADDDSKFENIDFMYRSLNGKAKRLNPSPSMVSRQARSEFLPRYHSARGMALRSMGSEHLAARLEAYLKRLSARIPMTRYFILHYAKNQSALWHDEEFHCRIAFRGGVQYERQVQDEGGKHPTGGANWLQPRVTSGHNQRQPDVEEKVDEILRTFQREQGGGAIAPNGELLRRIYALLVASDGRRLADGSLRYKGVPPWAGPAE